MHIRFENVGVTFPGQQPVLKGVSFSIPDGKRVALIGASGAGKSTVAGLLIRKRDPDEGVVYINDRPLSEYNLSSVLAHMGVILQRPEIISGTVRENILLAMPFQVDGSMTDDEIWKIIDLVSPEMRTRFNGHGLDTKVGKQGLQLSGGEQQRICVMRALIKQPEFLIVDEATSSLDSETEESVQQGIDTALSQGISALVIAHRFSTLRNCNHYIVLRRLSDCASGEPQVEAACDSLDELYDRSPTFKRLADKQGFVP
ncbi:MAG: ATP-binding cassette domain-containing protein [Candidatus Paceibacterota bacterium]